MLIRLFAFQLLTRDPTRRLGSGKGDAEEIKRHPFFKDVNFDDVLHKRIPPPYFPTIVRIHLPVASKDTTECALSPRTEARTRATSTRSSRGSNPRSRPCTHNCPRATRPSSTASLGWRAGPTSERRAAAMTTRRRPIDDTYYVLPVLSVALVVSAPTPIPSSSPCRC